MSRRLGWALLAAHVACTPAAPPGQAPSALGYTTASFEAERIVELRLQDTISSESLSRTHRALTRRPHVAGSAGAQEVAEYLRETLDAAGLETEVLEYEAFLSHPRRVGIEIGGAFPRRLSIAEPPLESDPDTGHAELGDAFIAYSPSGNVTAPLVYVNYGLPQDYAHLAERGVDVHGRLVLARYGRSHRAVKVYTAERAGAAGVILFSDPADDGFGRGEVWPPGYWRGEQMPQRGNAKYSWFWHGDPLTPGVAAAPGVERLDPASAPTLPRIPVAALAWGEARHLLDVLGGPPAPSSFIGSVPTTYRLGPSTARVRLEVEMDNRPRTVRNVVAYVRGTLDPERLVLLGGHHDAWTFGGVDPGTSASALVEVAKALGSLRPSGWRPARTIGVAFWDAEEYGLIGSTEFVEDRRRELEEALVVYVNSDLYMTGRFDPGGTPSLRDFVVDVAREVRDRDGSVLDHWRASRRRGPGEGVDHPPDVGLKPLGSGADFVPFQDHLGVPTLSIEFVGPNGYGFGPYHSRFDTRAYAERVADPGFAQGAVLARLLGTLALRMAGADILPFRFAHLVEKLAEAVDELAPSVDVGGIRERIERLRPAARDLERAIDDALHAGGLPAARAARLNDRLARLEQELCDDDGVPASRWYRHVIHGWNIHSLAAGQPFPGLAAALRDDDRRRAAHEITRIERALDRMLGALQAAARELQGAR